MKPALCLVAFVVLCTLNSAGYRYGASDQAFYVPAVLARLDPALFPRDGVLIASQARLTLMDETVGAVARVTSASIPSLFAALYLVSLGLLAAGLWLVGRRLYRESWTAVALLAATTLRHAISRTGANTLEGYFHPRQLAFGLGVLALAALLRRRWGAAIACVAVAGLVHPTTAFWFAVWIAAAALVNETRTQRSVLFAAAVGALVAGWACTMGPLAGRFSPMDPDWLATLTTKDYLFPIGWPLFAWCTNLAYIPIVAAAYRRRLSAGVAVAEERGLLAGCLLLAAIFLLSLPFNAARVAIVVQLQIPRVFWMLDLLATIYVVWALAESGVAAPRRAFAVMVAITMLSVVRGGYVQFSRVPARPIATLGIRADNWGQVMTWARSTPRSSGWIADPMHALKYGTSLRVAGERDVLVEEVKDTAIGMYDRGVAMRTRDRIRAVGNFGDLTPDRARALATQYGMDYLVTEQPLLLPQVYAAGALHVYALR